MVRQLANINLITQTMTNLIESVKKELTNQDITLRNTEVLNTYDKFIRIQNGSSYFTLDLTKSGTVKINSLKRCD